MDRGAKRLKGAAGRAVTAPVGSTRAAASASQEPRSVEEIYQKKSQLEHILLRPDSYVGSVERQTQDHFVFDDSAGRMQKKTLEYVPALYKIFDEILVNAADNLVRCPSQDTIRVEVNASKGYISVWNNGKGLPIQEHKEHGVYVPELVFGQLLTSDNYDDSEKKVTGGRNGYGAKLTNIFSSKFIVETADSSVHKTYKQVWENNMTKRSPPTIKSTPAGHEDFTQITFYPDFQRFAMTGLEADIAALMRRRAFDVAASTHGRCKVFLDGKRLEVASFEDYVNLYLEPETFRTCSVINDRWEIAIGLTDGSGFQQVSFVNSINTSRGGAHVNYVSDQIVNATLERTSKMKGGLSVKPAHIKGYLWVFVNCLIENPAFDSQTKETLTSKRDRFGSQCQLPDELIDAVMESGILDSLQEWSKAMGKSELAQHLNKSDLGLQKRLFGIPKLDDANKAGTKEGSSCTLILTEGDSAKTLAVAGLSIVGRDTYGVFPLRGKLRNVRDLTIKQMMENKEIEQLTKIMALDASKEYTDTKGLRYGSIMIMTDQDYDGSHIKGLIINFIQHWFPSLLRIPGFLQEFVTPIVKVTKGTESLNFFTVPEYEAWKEANNDGAGWKSKYYKGLGTSTSKEAKEYFAALDDHQIRFSYGGAEDDDLIDMAFQAKRADERKQWISECAEGTFVDHSQPELSYNDFIRKELVLFAKYDVQRAVPSLVDGFKPSQRKVLYAILKRKLSQDIKVAQLSGYVAEHSAYHHGEVSLQGTIIGMAQNFVGSNNINLLLPKGQFGTRLQGGKDHAASRYIFTRPSRTLRCMFAEDDDPVLEYQTEEGMTIEPNWYCPVIPLALVNGADGIGTGWSTQIPNYNPRDIIANIRRILKREPMVPMMPWYRGFKGTIRPVEGCPGRFEALGVAQPRGRVRLEISELPVKKWTQDYKEWLLEMLPKKDDDKRAMVTEVREYHSENSVHFLLTMTPDKLVEAETKGFDRVFHLKSSISTSNMWLFDAEGNIKKYETAEDIITAYTPIRLDVYRKRKAHLIAKMEKELAIISNKLKFVQMVVDDTLDVERRKTHELCNEMHKKKLQTMSEINGGAPVKDNVPEGYKYLLSMKMWSLTDDKLKVLQEQHDAKSKALAELKATSLEELWECDLVKLEAALDACDAEDAKEAEAAAKLASKKAGTTEDTLVNRQCILVLSASGGVKRVPTSEWKARKRGGNLKSGKRLVENTAGGGGEEEEDNDEALVGVFCCHDFDALLVFSEHGMVYKLQALDVPLAKKASARCTGLKEILPELGDNRIAAIVTVPHGSLRDQSDEFVVLVTKEGLGKKIALDKFKSLRPGKSMQTIRLDSGDEVRWVNRISSNYAMIAVTQAGIALRFSLGLDFTPSTVKGPGRRMIRFKPGDRLAACTIAKMTPQEIAARAAALSKVHAARAAAKDKAQGEGAESDNENNDNEDNADENNEGGEAGEAGEAEAEAEAGEAGDGPDGDGDADADNDTGGEAGTVAAAVAAAAAVGESGASQEVESRCALFVTASGIGVRMPLSSPKLRLSRRTGVGQKVMKVSDGSDRICGACIVSNLPEQKPPPRPRTAIEHFFVERATQKAEEARKLAEARAAEGASETAGDAPAAEDKPAGAETEEQDVDPSKLYEALSEAERAAYETRALEDKAKYEAGMEEYNQVEHEEVLLASKKGLISRIRVGSVPIVMKAGRGRVLVKLGRNDALCTVALLSSTEQQDESGEGKPASQSQGACAGAGASSSSAAVGAGTTAAKSSTFNPAPGLAVKRGRPGGKGRGRGKGRFAAAAAADDDDSAAGPEAAAASAPAASASVAAALSPSRRVRRKSDPASIALAGAATGATPRSVQRLSLRSPWPRISTPGSCRRLSLSQQQQRHVRLSIVKPKLRLLGLKRRPVVVHSLSLEQWTALATAPPPPPSTATTAR